MHQQLWLDLWHHFLIVMSAETIETRIAIGIGIAFLTVMSLTGIVDSFLPSRAARRYAAMYDLTPALPPHPPATEFAIIPAPSPVEQADLAPEPAEPQNDDMRYADGGVNSTLARRSMPSPPKVFRAQKP
jgi:hypothetical protein